MAEQKKKETRPTKPADGDEAGAAIDRQINATASGLLGG